MTTTWRAIQWTAKAVLLLCIFVVLPVYADESNTTPLLTPLPPTTISGSVSTAASPSANAFSKTPKITASGVIGKYIYVIARLPFGTKQATLEGRVPGKGWKPRMVQHLDGKTALMMFWAVPDASNEQYRVTVQQPNLPGKFWRGRRSFARLPAGFAESRTRRQIPTPSIRPIPPVFPPYTSTEPDIWAVSGNRIYYFNQYRGLQIIDATNPDSAFVIGTLDYPVVADKLYILDSTHVILLTEDCSADLAGSDGIQVVIVDVSSTPAIVASFPVNGSILTSRLVGSAVYVVTETDTSTGDQLTVQTLVSSFDCSNPASPMVRDSRTINFSADVLSACDQYLFFSKTSDDGSHSTISYIDISASNGTLGATTTVDTAGQITSKDNIDFTNNVLRTVSVVAANGAVPILTPSVSITNIIFSMSYSMLETFSLGSNPTRLGSISLGSSGFAFMQMATRFDGTRLYVGNEGGFPSTNRLSIIDLTDPTNPALASQIEIPDHVSTLYPNGNQLIAYESAFTGTLGSINSSLALFDVTDVSHPSQLSQVALDPTSEFAFNIHPLTILSDASLILVPHVTSSYVLPAIQPVSQIQLVDMSNNALAVRGVINQADAQRATYLNQRLISISGNTYLAADVSDRNNPVITRQVSLSWPVDRVFLQGDYLLEFGPSAFNQAGTALRIATAASPDQLISQWALTNQPVLGATLQSNRLYILQGDRYFYNISWPWLFNGNIGGDPSMKATLTVIDLSQLPDISIAGQTQVVINDPGSTLTPVWPAPGVLVWVGANEERWMWNAINYSTALPPSTEPPGPPLPFVQTAGPKHRASAPHNDANVVEASPSPTLPFTPSLPGPYHAPPVAPRLWPIGHLPSWPCLWRSKGVELIAFNVADDSAPALLSNITVATNGWLASGSVFTTNGLVYLSHSQQSHDGPMITASGAHNEYGSLGLIHFSWTESDHLDVIDFKNPTAPTVRDPIAISGPLIGISRNGGLIYTTSQRTTGENFIDASAYDGAQASLVASLDVGPDWLPATVISGETVYVSQSTDTNSTLSAWTVTDAATFDQTATLNLNAPTYQIRDFGGLLGLQGGSIIQLVDSSDPNSLSLLTAGSPAGCSVWPNLSGADGAAHRGVWVPLSDFGVLALPTQ
jgi:hypothetical protein